MQNYDLPKMSLVAQFDDLCRSYSVLTSADEEFKIFAEGQLRMFKKSKAEVEGLKTKVEKLQHKNSGLEFENGRLKTQNKALKDLLQDAVNRREKVESERNSLERQILLIKEVLLADGVMDGQTKEKLGFLSSYKPSFNSEDTTTSHTIQESVGSQLSLSDVDFSVDDELNDRTVLNLNIQQTRKRRSNSDSRVSQKKNKEGKNEGYLKDENEVLNESHKTVSIRCNSEPVSLSPVRSKKSHISDSTPFKNPLELGRYLSLSSSGKTPRSRYSTGGKLSRQHTFISKVLYRPEKCNPCRLSIGFLNQAFKCQDCAVICHPDCKDKCPVPCVPLVHTPADGATGTISDYTCSTAPMIPPLIVHCVNEVESRGFVEKGLYRVSGSEREVKLLKEKFLNSRTIPSLYRHDINAVCSTIKEFLRSLSEPLVTRNAWQEFVNAANFEDYDKSLQAIYNIVSSLPQPNRDTLAFLVMHLQRVSESSECKMPISSLAKIFGPTIIGYSVPDPTGINVLAETKDQYKVMERLLHISSDSWQNLLKVEPEVFLSNSQKTPDNLPAPKGSRLGPLFAPGQKNKCISADRSLRNSRIYKSERRNTTPCLN